MTIFSITEFQQNVIFSQQKIIAQEAASSVNSFISDKIDLLDNVVNTIDIVNYEHKERKIILEKILGKDSSILHVVLMDRNGDVIEDVSVTSEKNKINEFLSDIDLSSEYTECVGESFVDEKTNEPHIFICVKATDVFGDCQGFIVAEINLKFMWDIVDRIKVGETGVAYVVDSNGDLLAFRDTSRVLSGENMKYLNVVRSFVNNESENSREDIVEKGINGDYVVSSFISLGDPDWAVVVEIPSQEAFADIFEQVFLMIWLILISVVAVIIISFFISRKITRPLINLRNSAIAVGKGNLDKKIKIETNDEIGQLAFTFNQMTNDLRRSRKKIENYNKELESKVRERTKELDNKIQDLENARLATNNIMEDLDITNKKLSEAHKILKNNVKELKLLDKEKDAFISISAHELKTPLTAIHGFAQLLRNEKIFEKKKLRKKYLDIIDHETKRLAKLVTDILDLSRIDLGTTKFSLQNVNIYEVVNRIKEEEKIKLKGKPIRLIFDVQKDLPLIYTDKEKLTQILLNLIDNSIKYTPKGFIKVKIKKKKNNFEFSVSDNGVGIPKKSQKKIFTRFYQADSSYTRKVGGSGLGLSISREFVCSLGGKIWFKSKEGKGTTFNFTLPISAKLKLKE
ncbi:MAG: HAMP domain-containing protein [Candidatus Aenigmarchaeota archaeon]|nr:HAMP domain-containing protein [Candidatus Aenigmarchaeota archaeon]